MSDTLQVPSQTELSYVEKLCSHSSPYDLYEDRNEDFINAMKQSISWHRERNEFYRNLMAKREFDETKLNSLEDLANLPFIFANFFKKYEILSTSKEDVALHLTSSGTTGQKSQMFFDDWTIGSAQRMVTWIFEHYGWVNDNQKTNYLLYTYEPEEGSKLGTAYTDNYLCGYAPINKVTYALKYMGKEKGHKFDAFGVINALKEYEKEGLPVRIFGFPAFLHFTVETIKELGIEPIKLHPESLVFLGGGWKGNQDKAISKNELYGEVEKYLGIPNARLRDGFGSVEHCIPYVECENHNFHIPLYSEVMIRDVKTLEPKGYGETGYLNFISPYITSVPANNVLMGDLAVKYSAEECGCGLKTDWFEIIGRAGVSKNRSCAIAAADLLKEFSK